MLEFEFESMEEFDTLFDSSDAESVRKVTDAIFQGIQEAFNKGEKEAELFSISFRNADDGLDVSATRLKRLKRRPRLPQRSSRCLLCSMPQLMQMF